MPLKGLIIAVKSPPLTGAGLKPEKFAFLTPTLASNALYLNSSYVSCFQECFLLSWEIIIATKFGIYFIDNSGSCLSDHFLFCFELSLL